MREDLIERARLEVELRVWMHGADRSKWTRAERVIEELLTALEAAREDAERIDALEAIAMESLTTELRLVRGERDRAMQACETIAGHLAKAEAWAERLAEALRDAANDLDRGVSRGDVAAHLRARAALKQEDGK